MRIQLKNFLLGFLFVVAAIIILSLPIILLITLADFHFDILPKYDVSMRNLHDAFIIILTIFLVIGTFGLGCVAWVQLTAIQKTERADFLFRIDERYGSEIILKARQIIQRLYRESNNLHPGAPESVHRSHIAIRINEISENINTSEEYVYLLNLLDLLETISYFANNGLILESEIQNLMGPSMEFFFIIFKPRIEHRREKYRNESYYCEFQKLVENTEKIKKTRNK